MTVLDSLLDNAVEFRLSVDLLFNFERERFINFERKLLAKDWFASNAWSNFEQVGLSIEVKFSFDKLGDEIDCRFKLDFWTWVGISLDLSRFLRLKSVFLVFISVFFNRLSFLE